TLTTDADGTFAIHGVRAAIAARYEDRTELSVAAEGLAVHRLSVEPPAPGETRQLTINLLPWGRLSGTVVQADGRPAAGARVTGWESPLAGVVRSGHFPRSKTSAAADGSFELR